MSISRSTCSCRDVTEGEARGFEIVPDGLPVGDRRVYLDIHGGALIIQILQRAIPEEDIECRRQYSRTYDNGTPPGLLDEYACAASHETYSS